MAGQGPGSAPAPTHSSSWHCCGSQHLPLVCAPLLIQHQPLHRLPPPWHMACAFHFCSPQGFSIFLTPLPFVSRVQLLCGSQEKQGCRGCFQDGNRTGQEFLPKKRTMLIHLLSLPALLSSLSGSGSSSMVFSGAFPCVRPGSPAPLERGLITAGQERARPDVCCNSLQSL